MTADDMTREIPKRVREITGGRGVPVVYDSGRQGHADGLARQPAGARNLRLERDDVGPVVIDTTLLAVKGSIWMTRPAMIHYATPRAHMLAMADGCSARVRTGKIVGEPKAALRPRRRRRCATARSVAADGRCDRPRALKPERPRPPIFLRQATGGHDDATTSPAAAHWFAIPMTLALMLLFDYIDRQVIVSLFRT